MKRTGGEKGEKTSIPMSLEVFYNGEEQKGGKGVKEEFKTRHVQAGLHTDGREPLNGRK